MSYVKIESPTYVRPHSSAEFSSSVVESGAVLQFWDGEKWMQKHHDGTFTVVGGGTQVISSGAEVTLGYLTSDGKFQPVAFSGTSAADNGSPVALSCYSWNIPGQISGGGSSSGGEVISSGGSSSGGSSFNHLTIDVGLVSVTGNTYYDYTTINSGAGMNVSGGGTANSTTVNSGGSMCIGYGGSASGITVNRGGKIYIYDGAYVQNLTISSGCSVYLEVTPGTYVSGSKSEHIFASFMLSGGILSGYIADQDEFISVNPGGTANSTTVNSGGNMVVFGDGTANSTTVNSGGSMNILSGGYVTSVVVSSGGTLRIQGGAVVANLTSSAGAAIVQY